IAATAADEVVRNRGHKFDEDRKLPLVVSNEVENLLKTSDAKRFLTSIGVWDDIDRVRKSKRIKAGARTHAVGAVVVVDDDKNATKNDVKREVEELYEVNVSRVFTLTTPEGNKKAYVKLSPESKASDLAVKLGLL